MGGADRGRDLVGVGVLEQVARGAGLERRVHALLLAERRQRDDLDVVVARADPPRRLDPVDRLHLEVHQHDVRQPPSASSSREQRERLVAARRVADDARGRARCRGTPSSPRRTTAWSSTTRTRIVASPSGAIDAVPLIGDLDADDRAAARRARRSSAARRSRRRGCASTRARSGRAGSRVGSKPRPSSRISSTTRVRRRPRPGPSAVVGAGVLDDVRQRLARDAEQLRLDRAARARRPRPGASTRDRRAPSCAPTVAACRSSAATSPPSSGSRPSSKMSARISLCAPRVSSAIALSASRQRAARGPCPSARAPAAPCACAARVEKSACETESCRSRAIRWRSSSARSPSRRLRLGELARPTARAR